MAKAARAAESRRLYASALRAESTRVVRAVGMRVHDLASRSAPVLPPSSWPLECVDELPAVLTLAVGNLLDARGHWYDHVSDAGGPSRALKETLSALALVLKHSQLLDRGRVWKAFFWWSVFGGVAADYHDWLADVPRYPAHIELTFQRASGQPVTSKLTDAIFDFLTTPAGPSPSELIRQRSARRKISTTHVGIGLSFANTGLTIEGLQLVAELLERVSKSPDRQYTLEMLDLSYNVMDPVMLTVVTEILKKIPECQVKDIRLDEIACGLSISTRSHDDQLQQLLQVALGCNAPSQSRLTHRQEEESGVRNLSLAGNRLGARDVAIICSSLRYDCALDALSLASTFVHVNPRERGECWRWLAFGVFGPRSKRSNFNTRLRKIDLSKLGLDHGALEAVMATMTNPVAALRHLPDSELERSQVLICAFKRGCRIYSSRDTTASVVLVLSEQRELETLYSARLDDDWRCVVVPAFGLGWVESHQIQRVVEELSVHQVPRSHCDLVLRNLSSSSTSDSLGEFLALVGSQLRSLDLGDACGRLPFQEILDHSSEIRHLALIGVGSVGEFLETMSQSKFGRNLLSLNLTRANLDSQDVEIVIALLEPRQNLSALRELRLGQISIIEAGLAHLHEVLKRNHRLVIIELEAPSDRPEDLQRRVARDRLNDAYDKKTAFLPVSRACKAAFASVLSNPKSRVFTAQFMDVPLLNIVLEFAADRAIRRLIWTTA